MDLMWQSACLVVNAITAYSYGFLLNCTNVDQTFKAFTRGLVPDACVWLGPPWLNLRFSSGLSMSREAFSLFHHSVFIWFEGRES